MADYVARVEEGAQVFFQFNDCSYTVGKGPNAKVLIRDISGSVRGGHLLAIMGPSGAGKTVLMRLLTLEKGTGVPRGSLKLNGQPFTRTLFRKACAYVTQIDRHCAFLTAREHLEVAISLFQSDRSPAEQVVLVDELLKKMGLISCQHTRAGNEFIRGLSGGQSRRLSLGVALSKDPALVFLDEPTSGLDAAAASSVMDFLKKSAASTRAAIICTIHQPSYRVFSGFDDTLILSVGRTAYFGAASELRSYLDKIGRPVLDGSNPPEHMLDLVNKDFSSAEGVDAILAHFKYVSAPTPLGSPSLADRCKTPLVSETWILFKKLLKLVVKDPILYVGRSVAFLVFCAFFAIVYVKARDVKQDQLLSRLFFIMWICGVRQLEPSQWPVHR